MHLFGVSLVLVSLLGLSAPKVFSRCELARFLKGRTRYQSTWVCIAYHESRYNTAAINPTSQATGIFQIMPKYWCDKGNKGCGIPCSKLKDDDIRDDIRCAVKIYNAHSKISSNGFKAWEVWPRCSGDTSKWISGC